MRALAARPEAYAEVALLLVCDEEWRTGASPTSSASPAGTPACASRAASRRPTATTASSCAARRPARSTSTAHGRAAHSGSAPDRGRNALLALAAAAQAVAACHDPDGPAPPDGGADRPALRRRVQRRARRRRAVLRLPRRRARRDRGACSTRSPPRSAASTLTPELIRRWPGMHSSAAAAPLLERAAPRSAGRSSACRAAARATPATSPPRSRSRSTASARAAASAHNPGEYVVAELAGAARRGRARGRARAALSVS